MVKPVVETLSFIQNLSLILAVVALTACANNPEQMPSQQPQTMTNCISEEAGKLVGQTGLSEAVIKTKTKAETVRMVAPDQPVTLDYRSNRVTVVTDPKTKIIVQASCG